MAKKSIAGEKAIKSKKSTVTTSVKRAVKPKQSKSTTPPRKPASTPKSTATSRIQKAKSEILPKLKEEVSQASTQLTSLEKWVNVLNSVLTKKDDQDVVSNALQEAQGDWTVAVASLKDKLPDATVQKLDLTHSLADWSGDNMPIVNTLVKQADVSSMRDVALQFNVDKLAAVIDPITIPETTTGSSPEEKQRNFAVDLHKKLFLTETSAVLQRMAQDAELPMANDAVRSNVATILNNVPQFNIRTTSIYTALQHPECFKGIPVEQQGETVAQLKTLALVQAISPVPEAVPALMKANLTSAFHVTEMPESTFMSAHSEALGGEEVARQIYANAIDSRVRNEHALMSMHETVRGSGMAIIDGQETRATRMRKLQDVTDRLSVPLNLESLFGGVDYCECGECLSVYSPASYFVEVLNYLRNNNLGPDPKDPGNPNSGTRNDSNDISNTPLEKLFRRRPDLGNLELTCENTFTVMPYIDLVNEVMESFVVHLGEYHADTNNPKQATLEAFNVVNETSSELLAIPQHFNYEAYRILKDAVYPFTLPYHQPIDATRIFLNYLGTSRYELLDTYRTAHESASNSATQTPADKQVLQTLHEIVLERAVDAEFLGLTQEEYIILTQEAFWPKHYFEIVQKKSISDTEYLSNIGVKAVYEYFGYANDTDMVSVDESITNGHKGLTFVKEQFLRRTGIQYVDLVELLKTRFINPDFPQGKALTILESLRFSYRFLQTLVNSSSNDPNVRYSKLVEFLQKEQTGEGEEGSIDWRQWVYTYFERLGKLFVLESGESSTLVIKTRDESGADTVVPLEGKLYSQPKNELVGYVSREGVIFNAEKTKVIGQVGIDVMISWEDGKTFGEEFGPGVDGLDVRNDSISSIAWIGEYGIMGPYENSPTWTEARDTCDLDKVRLTRLDGSPLIDKDYERMHRFIRLWKRIGWTIDETDKALTSELHIQIDAGAVGGSTVPPDPTRIAVWDITVGFLHQLAAIRKLIDQTGLSLPVLLTFWGDISTAGEKSLYSTLFLAHNMVAIDTVFQADKNGNYLTQTAKITEHLPVLMAAFKLKADDITAIMRYRNLTDTLTLANVSAIYRYSLLAKLLHVKITDLADLIGLFGDPFLSPQATLNMLGVWGKMEDASFTFRQLNYLIQNHDDPLRPLAPSEKTILTVAKMLFDGLNGIDKDNPDIPEDQKDLATDDLIRAKAGLLFEQQVVEKVIALLDGTSIYTTNAPINQTITIPADLSKKLKYSNQNGSASIQVIGILTGAETAEAKTLCNLQAWSQAIDRIAKQVTNLFNDVLFGIFPDAIEAKLQLLAGDVTVSDPKDPANTAPQKRLYFLKCFMPFLRTRMSHRLTVDIVSGVSGLTSEITDILLSDILVVGSPKHSAIDALEQIKNRPAGSATGWKGYLIPSVEDAYTFVATSDTQPAPLVIDGQTVPFSVQQEDPSNIWSTDPSAPIKLKAGKLYLLEVADRSFDQLSWKTASSPATIIPSASLLPDYSAKGVEEVFIKLTKSALLVNGFSLSAEDASYWQSHAADFDGFDFNAMTMKHWKRMQAYTDLRDKLPKTGKSLLDLFLWATKPDMPETLSARIAAATLWKKENIDKLLTAEHFALNSPANFRSEVNLIKLRKAIEVAGKIDVDTDRLFDWAMPGSQFAACQVTAESIRNAIRARFNEDEWEQVVKPLNDQLRENQKQALISYLVVQQDLIDWGVVDADSLFEFFLIDVQMGACMETSRIKQAISSVQLFVQRCMLGLEADHHVPNDVLDRERWSWMQKYRVWEANRKVFLYPENWIDPQLRDDKSPFYKELESEMLQKDINTQNVTDALKSYLYKVDEVANMEVVGLYVDGKIEGGFWSKGTKLHVFSRTRNAPYFFYYRYLSVDEGNWYPWEKMQVDIPSYDTEDSGAGKITNGCYLTPAVWNGRLFVFFPQFTKKTKPNESTPGKSFTDIAKDTPNSSKPTEYWEIKMAWSECRNGKWTQKQLSKDAIYDVPAPASGTAGATLSDVVTAVQTARNEAQNANDKTDSALTATGQALILAETSRAATASATNTIPPLLIGGPLTMAAVIAIVNDVHDKAVSAKSGAAAANSASATANNATASSLGKADSAVTIVDSYANASGANGPAPCGNISKYEFVPVFADDSSSLAIRVFYNNNSTFESTERGKFEFNGNSLQVSDKTFSGNNNIFPDSFHYQGDTIRSLQPTTQSPRILECSFTRGPGVVNFEGEKFYHPYIHDLLARVGGENLDPLFGYYQDHALSAADEQEAFGWGYHELARSYSIYNWELGFHAPMEFVDRMLKAQQFDQALNMIHYVLDPSAKGVDATRFWQFPPFKEIYAKNVLESLFLGLKPNQSDGPYGQISEWRNKPFQPHVIARSRPSAYMKYVAMKYIEILIAYGDYYFRQFTLETIPLAIQCYVLASHVYGSRGQKIPKRGKIQPQSYKGLLDKWDAFGNAMVEMELAFPFSNQTPLPPGGGNGVVGLSNVFGFATSLYFCIPDNPQMRALRDTIDDRLFKIRHCQDIEGVTRKLPLFEPPIDPGLLVQAAVQGLSLSSVLNDLNSPMPNYRFYYLLQKALELCSEVKALSNAFLSAKEKGDAEALSQLRAMHETNIHNLVMEVKKQQLDEAQKSLGALQQSRLGPKSRMEYYLKLIGEVAGKVPDADTDFSELANQIEQPVDESGLKLISYEKEGMDKANTSADLQLAAGITETLASILYVIPMMSVDGKPVGVGAGVEFGGINLGQLTQAVTKGLQIAAGHLQHQSSSAFSKGGFLRQLQDRVQQANAAGYEIKHIDKQILAQQIRIDMANQEITNQQQQIDNAREVEDYLKSKYTNQELYGWMEGQIRTLNYQAYTLAYDLAKRTEKIFRFERGLSTSNFIQFGYWDAGHDGLMAGERLYIGLKQLESAYQEERGHDFEISSSFSLRQINPRALIQLKETGLCEFSLPEVLFDMSRPGDYMRRIKSVALSIPCIVGPYTGLNCTLRLLEHEFRNNTIVTSGYPKKTDEADDRFSTVNVPITSIATSTGQNDSGVFELNFRDERYMPFEGAGAICKMRLEFPGTALRQVDYDTITDVVIHLRYTAMDGGDKLKGAADGFVKDYIKKVEEISSEEGLFTVFDLRHDYPDEWYKATHPATGSTERVMVLDKLIERLPVFTKGRPASAIQATAVSLFTPSGPASPLSSSSFKLTTTSGEMSFEDGVAVGNMKSFVIQDVGQLSGWQLHINDLNAPLDKLWMIVRYTLQ